MNKFAYNMPRTENRPLLLENPQNQCQAQKVTSVLLSLMFWGVLLYALAPAWTWLLTELGYEKIAFTWFSDFIGLEAAAHKIKMVLYWGVVLAMVPVTWAIHNWAVSLEQNANKKVVDKRPYTTEEVALWAGVTKEDLTRWRSSQRMVVHLDGNARITGVDATNLN